MSIASLQEILGWRASRVRQLMVKAHDHGQTEHVTLTLGNQPAKDTDEMIRLLSDAPSVVTVRRS